MGALSSSTAAWLRLCMSPGVGNATMRRLLAAFSLPENIFDQDFASLAAVVTQKQAAALLQEPPDYSVACAALAAWLDPTQRWVLTLADADYPRSLLEMEDPPAMLYVQCQDRAWWRTWCHLEQAPLLAVVGSRNPTPQGEKNAQALCGAMVQQGWGIVSGLALGIDAAAHYAALQAQGRTIAVVGTGLDRVYPRQHHALAHSIVEQGGAILSEFALGTGPLASNFPRRNRLIAGLAVGTLVVEANLQSGSLITARLALEQNKEVFAIPGSIHAPQYKGCHALIKQGAKLVESAADISDELPTLTRENTTYLIAAQAVLAAENEENILKNTPIAAWPENSDDQRILAALAYEPTSLDELQLRTQLDAATIQIHLLELELAARVQRLPGGRYQQIAPA